MDSIISELMRDHPELCWELDYIPRGKRGPANPELYQARIHAPGRMSTFGHADTADEALTQALARWIQREEELR